MATNPFAGGLGRLRPAGARTTTATAAADTKPQPFTADDLQLIKNIASGDLLLPSTCKDAIAAKGTIVLDGISKPISDFDLNAVKTDFTPEWWFTYFWMEAVPQFDKASASDIADILAFFNKAFIRPPNFRNNTFVLPRGGFTTANPRLFSENELREHLATILRVGFEFTSQGTSGNPEASTDLMVAHTHFPPKGAVHYQLVWRGENYRSFQELRAKGAKTQASDANRSKTINTDKVWHPFYDVTLRGRLWYRKNQNDNCLYSAISVATTWKAAVCFPKIAQTPKLLEIQKKVQGGETLEALAKSYPEFIGIARIDGKKQTCLVTSSKVALIVLDGMYFDTKQMQEVKNGPDKGYPELATRTIAGSNYLAMVEFVRVHHGITDDDGFTCFVVNSTVIDRERMLMTFGDEKSKTAYYSEVSQTYEDAAKREPRAFKWVSTGYKSIDVLPRIFEVQLNGKRVWS